MFLYLNTSHVKVNQDLDNITSSGLEYLNTSHVKVNLLMDGIVLYLSLHLNTSHVKVNQNHYHFPLSLTLFKYISC